MWARMFAVGVFALALTGVLATCDLADAAAKVKKADKADKAKKKKAKKKQAEPLNTDAIFQKLDTNGDKQLDLTEFKNLFTVQAAPKGKKAKEAGPIDLDFAFKSLDADGDKKLSMEEFKGIVPAIFPAGRK